MTRVLSYAAFVTGMALIILMTRLVAADDRMTLLVMLLIVTAYSVGATELWRYQRQTGGLRLALGALDTARSSSADAPTLDAWLSSVPEALRHAVHQRIVGQFQGLPAPMLTPYLVGLLVMLGLMGTFVGMVATLGGAALALEGGTELTAIRQGLAAPIEGLGMAFGTSVAGVAASAMLGLIATLSQRERLQLSKVLDQCRDEFFRDHSLHHQRRQTYSALQQQAGALPDAVASLAALGEQLGQLGEQLSTWSERSSEQLVTQQREFETAVRTDFQALTATLSTEVKNSLASTGKETAETLRPFVGQLLEQASEQLVSEAAARRQVEEERQSAFQARQTEELETRRVAEADWLNTMGERVDTLVAELGNQLGEIQSLERERLENSGAQIVRLQESLGERLEGMSSSIHQSVASMESAAQASTRMGTDLLDTLQSHSDRSLERDTLLMEERSTLLQEQRALIESLKQRDEEQQGLLKTTTAAFQKHVEQQSGATADNLDRLMTQSAQQLADVSESLFQQMASTLESNEEQWRQLSSKLGMELEQLLARNAEVLDQFAGSLSEHLGASGQQIASTASDLAALSGGFADSVAAFKASSETVDTSLKAITEALTTSASRSDEQMGYYVDQAREIIDHNLLTQQAILERLESVISKPQVEAEPS
ncbi:membrane protein [Congregibacter litoralis]|uniref:DUF802 domain-containing protein n=1 Tax=Congregibacter litoralis KT71 TaxID=314285 RepID=A4AAW7_9GAMM|nr:membrane protein [Congregibacter litoralis]EAQ96839.1 hypothetical protein KT71_11079 [Congregibacter litoralis KT71]